MNGLPYYKRYPRDFIEATAGWSFELKCSYSLILDLIYMQGGELPDDPRYISGILGCTVRKWNILRKELISRDKIQVNGELLSNYRADKLLETTRKYQDKQAQNASGPRNNKGLAEPPHKPKQNHSRDYTDTDTNTLPKGNDNAVVDLSKVLFSNGVKYLEGHGVKESQARSVIGRWRKDCKDADIFQAFTDANKGGVVDPISYITEILKPKENNEDRMSRIMEASK